ncbi:hypothetical protein AVEN_104191-1 [Araneus ventricosus]|uniref:Uncharacterized protein n=1 Tax=Araneus ventricosus TaxID=182803 RepID=A0A4Y2JP43_ARAVE|nr:hypothetical protein AVEN_104191-1 [Araneus ventricosus]
MFPVVKSDRGEGTWVLPPQELYRCDMKEYRKSPQRRPQMRSLTDIDSSALWPLFGAPEPEAPNSGSSPPSCSPSNIPFCSLTSKGGAQRSFHSTG